MALDRYQVVNPGIARALHAPENRRTPVSDELYDVLHQPFRDLIPSDDEYQDTFDRFEYLLSLAQADWWLNSGKTPSFSGGSYTWRGRYKSLEWIPNVFASELERDDTAWAPLDAGMFGGDIARLKRAKKDVDKWVRQYNF